MFKKIIRPFRKFSPKTYWKELVAIFVLLLAFVFFRNERKELSNIIPQLRHANYYWLLIGFGVSIIYILLQGWMYITSFRAFGLKINMKVAVELFLKRNFLSVFLPAGGITALAYTTSELRKRKLNATQIHQAGALYGYVGLLTVFIIGLPIIVYTLWKNQNFGNAWVALVILGVVLSLALGIVFSVRSKNILYQKLENKFPQLATNLDNLFSSEVDPKYIWYTIFISTLIECTGIIHVFVSMYALGLAHSFEAAAVGYTVSVVLMIVSPFLRGLGAVEFSMLFIFKNYGYSQEQGLAITLIYRTFEFWIPLLFGVLSFAWRGKQIVSRILPAFLIFFLGIVNLISVATPPLADRMRLDHFYLPQEAIHASKLMVLVVGLGLIVASAYLIKGYRAAFWLSVIFCILSLIGNLVKALDYEESIVALIALIFLIINRHQYRIKSSVKWVRIGFTTFISVFCAVFVFEIISFYFIDHAHFGKEFSWKESVYYALRSFLLFEEDLIPKTVFGHEFLQIIRVLGFSCWLLFLYTLLRPSDNPEKFTNEFKRLRAQLLLNEFGNSPIDFFKLAKDKQLFFSRIADGFTAYRVANGFAVVLDEPVCDAEDKQTLIEEFDDFCLKKGLKSVYYRVEENNLTYFSGLKKQKILIGQEAILTIEEFHLEGKDRKSLRNGLNSLAKKDFVCQAMYAPLPPVLVQQLKAVSDDWLKAFEKKEMVFSQGMFDVDDVAQQDVIVIKDVQGNISAFLTIIPDYAAEECTYDLIRKTENAPGGCMDGLIVTLISYAKEKGFKYLNLGMVPLSGFDNPDNPAEKIMKFVSDKIPGFSHYQSLRNFKDKYATIWENRYLVFDYDFDLLQLPAALNKVMKPVEE